MGCLRRFYEGLQEAQRENPFFVAAFIMFVCISNGLFGFLLLSVLKDPSAIGNIIFTAFLGIAAILADGMMAALVHIWCFPPALLQTQVQDLEEGRVQGTNPLYRGAL